MGLGSSGDVAALGVDNGGGGGKTKHVYCLFVACVAKSNVSVCQEST